MFPNLKSFDDDATLADNLSDEIAECLRHAIRERGIARIALSGGSTPQKTYSMLSKQELDWDKVEIILADERWAPASHPRSNHCLLNITLFKPLGHKPRFIPLYRDGVEPSEAVDELNEEVRGIERPFDLVLLGIGNDGHTASLFPQGDQLKEALDPEDPTLVRVMNAPGVPEPRITLTLRALLDTRRIVLVFSGEDKYQTFETAIEDGEIEDMPIRAVLKHARVPVEVFYTLGTKKKDKIKCAAVEAAWKELDENWVRLKPKKITQLFEEDAERFSRFSVQTNQFLLDYSKTKIDATAKDTLVRLAKAKDLEQKRDAMFAGERINVTENRAVGHVALRNRPNEPFIIDGKDVMPDVKAERDHTNTFANDIRSGRLLSSSGETYTDIVNIGIGGSDLGPAMLSMALHPYCDGPKTHYVSNVDGAHITDTIAKLNPQRTLFLISSKTFTTVETLTNANTARRWIAEKVGEENVGAHFAAISSAIDKAQEFGISKDLIFGNWDWVGGRYSVWGAIGLPIIIAIGPERFGQLLEGAHDMDEHFRTAPLEDNMPVMLGLVGIWHNDICGYRSRALLPYDQRLARFPIYVQQLDMESNGKVITLEGEMAGRDTGPIVWGGPGTNGQHAFFQLLHQGSQIIPTEFMIAAKGHEPELTEHHDLLIANCLAQSEALMKGRSTEDVMTGLLEMGMLKEEAEKLALHKTFSGDRPSITMMYPILDPYTLGQLVALYEHRVFVEGCIWGVNSFDQWGVELGKELAKELYPFVRDKEVMDSVGGDSTASLLDWRKRFLQ